MEKRRILVYNWKQEEVMTIYGLEDKVPVDIWDGKCEVDFKKIMTQTTETQENLLL